MTRILSALRAYLTRDARTVATLQAENDRLQRELRQARMHNEMQAVQLQDLSARLDGLVMESVFGDGAELTEIEAKMELHRIQYEGCLAHEDMPWAQYQTQCWHQQQYLALADRARALRAQRRVAA